MALQYRYPGAKPFQTEESHVFYGRVAVSQELYQLLSLEPLVVLHAKSGLGKSSVVNAGLMPIVVKAKEYDPFNIRFYAYTEGKKESPLSITQNVVQSQSDLLDKIRPEGDDSLWYHLKSLQLAASDDKGILLVFDQFEELFTYSDSIIEEFARQLSEALYTTLPQRFRDKRREGFEKDKNFLSDNELASLDQGLHLRLLMVIRSDRMSLMKKLKAYFPTILSADFELQALEREQAEDAILSPAYQKTGFVTPVFDYEDAAIEYLLDFLSEDGTEAIESFQLQILCEYVEQHLVEKQNKQLIQKQDIANPDQILENYYLDKINSIPNAEDRLAARRLIEEGFIFEEEERRLTLYEGQIFKSYGITSDLLNQLLDTHLIRSEPSLRGGYTYELSHDTLVAPVLKAKAKRKDAERLIQEKEESQKRETELQALREKEEAARRQAEKEKELRTAAEKNEQRARQRTRLATVVSILALLLSGLAFWLYRNAEASNKISEIKTQEAIEAQTATAAALETAEERRIEAEEQTALAEENEQKAIDAEAETEEALKDALTQTRLAEKRKSEAETATAKAEAAATAAQNASLVLRIAKTNPTLALGIADYNLKKHQGAPAAAIAFREVINDLKNKYFKQSFQGHSESVYAVAFSPDGKTILTGSFDNTAKLWDLSGQELESFQGHSESVYAVAFSPDGKTILTGSFDNTAKLWDLSGQELESFQGHSSSVYAVAFSPEGKTILTGSSDNTAKLWDLSGQELESFQGHSSSVSAVAFSPEGKTILTGSSDNTAKLWDLSGQELESFQGHSESVYAVAFSPDGKTILTGSLDKTAKLWDLSGQELESFQGHSESVFAVAFSPDGKTILTGSSDDTAKLWDLFGQELESFQGHSSWVSAVAFSPDGKTILTGSSDDTAKLWDLSGQELESFQGLSSYVSAVAFSPDGKTILTGSLDKTAKLWDLSGQELQSFQGHSSWVSAVAFSPDGKTILTGSRDKTAKLWDLFGQELESFQGHSESVFAVAFSPDGKTILAGSRDKTAKLWDLSGQELQSFQGHSESVDAVAFSPNGKTILTGSRDKTAKLWDLSGQELESFQGLNSSVSAVAFSPACPEGIDCPFGDGKTILTGSLDKTAKLWDLSGQELQSFQGHSSWVSAVAFSPDGKTILTGSSDYTAKLWDLSGQELESFQGHSDIVSAVAFSPDGKTILTGSRDYTVKLWLMPQAFLDQKVHHFTLQELYDAGVILDEEDLKKVKQREK